VNPLDRQLLALVNGIAGGSKALFEICLLFCGELPLALCVAVLLSLWWSDPERGGGMATGPVLPGGNAPRSVGLAVSRRRCAALACAVAASFVVTRLIAFATNWPRPLGREQLIVPIEPERWRYLVEGMTGFGAFPSDHAALFFALATGLFAWSAAAGAIGLAAAALFCLCRVAVGFHYPSDMLVGGAIGAGFAAGSLRLARGPLAAPLDRIVGWFDRRPAVAYPLLFLVALDFTQHFRLVMGGVFKVVFTLRSLLGGR
jgi:membrane-associated phospholipid phosphatase